MECVGGLSNGFDDDTFNHEKLQYIEACMFPQYKTTVW